MRSSQGVDIALAAFGVGKGSAKMADEGRAHDLRSPTPAAFASAAQGGRCSCAGDDDRCRRRLAVVDRYLRNIGDKEKKSEELKFDFLGLYRPAGGLGNSNTPSALGFVMPLFNWAMPSRYHSIHKNDLARAMVAQTEQAFLALRGAMAPALRR